MTLQLAQTRLEDLGESGRAPSAAPQNSSGIAQRGSAPSTYQAQMTATSEQSDGLLQPVVMTSGGVRSHDDNPLHPRERHSSSFLPTAHPRASAQALTRNVAARPATRNAVRDLHYLRSPAAVSISRSFEGSPRRWNRLMRFFMLAGVVGTVLSMLVIAIDGALRPGYSAISDVISDLGGGLHAWVLNKDLIATGLLIMFFAIGSHGAMGNALGRKCASVMTGLFLLAGAGIVNDGVFTEYKALQLHLLGFYTAFSALTLVFFLVGARLVCFQGDRDWRWRHYGWYSLITGLIVLSLVIVYVALPTYATDIQGLLERLIVGAAFGWQIVTTVQFLRPQERTGNHATYHLPTLLRAWRRGALPHQG